MGRYIFPIDKFIIPYIHTHHNIGDREFVPIDYPRYHTLRVCVVTPSCDDPPGETLTINHEYYIRKVEETYQLELYG